MKLLLADMSPLADPLGLSVAIVLGLAALAALWFVLVRGVPALLLRLLPQEPGDHQPRPLLFFDGVCGLCNHAVDFILVRDKHERFLFAALQGETAERQLGRKPDDPLDSLILIDATGRHERSSGALRIAWHLGGIWRVVSWLRVVPKPLRDPAYDLIARLRYRLFGKKETCRLPTPAERARFLA